MSKKIVVDAGHGGTDPGASSNIVEKEYNLKIANYIYTRLKELGIPVAITRTTDEYISPNDRVNRILNAFGNSNDVIVISNHLNAGGGRGSEVVYALRNDDTLSKLILENIAKQGQSIRKWYQRRLPSDPSKDYYFIHRLTGKTEPVLIEYGFVDNAADAEFIKNNWQKLAEATVKAVANYIGIPYDDSTETGIYIVQKGDSLYSIAKKYNVSVDKLKEENNLTSNLISINQKLIIPGFVDNTESKISYIVQKGDSLYSIANKYGITVNELKNYNNLSSTVLSIGQVLKIPEAQEIILDIDESNPTNNYVVQYGDTIYSIATNNNLTVAELTELNNLTDSTLYVGQILKIPTYAGEEKLASDEYSVKKGDNLYSIARKYDTTVDELKRLNNLTSNNLDVGQILKIPTTKNDETAILKDNTYIVQRGDTLYGIARQYNMTVSELKAINNLTSNILSIGQIIKISN